MSVLGFPEEWLPSSRSSLDVANGQKPDSNFQFQGGYQCLNLEFAHGRSGFQPTVEFFQKAAMEVVVFGGFLRWIFWLHNRIRQPKTKIHRRTTPGIHQPGPKIRRFFRLSRLALGGVFRAWILGHSLAAFWAWSRLPC